MAADSLGRLHPVDLRDVWASEAGDFTPWLAKPDNLAMLGETLKIELELEAQEKDVGPFRADILCKNTADNTWVLIENQIERTDHTHLGQLLTYAAGLKAVTIVWVARRFTEEHRATLDWLNQITDESFNFFGLEVELWRIGDSLAAPKFNVVSKPNDWSKTVTDAARRIEASELSDTRQLQLAYWTELADYMAKQGSPIRPQTPRAQYWMTFAIGRSDFDMSTRFSTMHGYIAVNLACKGDNGKAHLALLKRQQREIEADLGAQPIWRVANKHGLVLLKQSVDTEDRTDWPRQHEWLAATLEQYDRVFRNRIRELNAEEAMPEEIERLEESDPDEA